MSFPTYLIIAIIFIITPLQIKLPTNETLNKDEIEDIATTTPEMEEVATTGILEAHTVPLKTYTTWKKKLRKCESGFNDHAVNPVDLDGTPSYGRFQFKPETFFGFAKQYGIKVNNYMDGNQQELILDRMITDKTLNLKFQFPGCIRKIGLPVADV